MLSPESPLEERNTATPPTNSNGLGVAHPIATPTQPLNTERNTSLDPDDFWNQEVDMAEMEDLDRAVLREGQARHVLALLRKSGPQDRGCVARLCCGGNPAVVNEIRGSLVRTGELVVERGQVHYARPLPGSPGSFTHGSSAPANSEG